MDSSKGVLGLKRRKTQEDIEIFFRTHCLICMHETWVQLGMASGARLKLNFYNTYNLNSEPLTFSYIGPSWSLC